SSHSHPPFLDLSWRKGSFIPNLPLASHHSITSSARASTAIGNERPSSFAVLRLMISSIFVDWETGSSAGFSPLRILVSPAQNFRSVAAEGHQLLRVQLKCQ